MPGCFCTGACRIYGNCCGPSLKSWDELVVVPPPKEEIAYEIPYQLPEHPDIDTEPNDPLPYSPPFMVD